MLLWWHTTKLFDYMIYFLSFFLLSINWANCCSLNWVMKTTDWVYISIFLYLATSVESVSNDGIGKLWSPAFQIFINHQIPWGIGGGAAILVSAITLSTTHQFLSSFDNDILAPPGSSTLFSVLDLRLLGGEFNQSKPFCQNESDGGSKDNGAPST